MCTERGRVYWVAQNEKEHTTPDWKFHFSVEPEHVPNAWNILVPLFIASGLDIGMKARTDFESWPESQWGRELTVYIYRHDSSYEFGGPMANLPNQGNIEALDLHEYWLGPEFERPWSDLLLFATEAERQLLAAGILPHGGSIANGDLQLPSLVICSLRNEAYVPEEEQKGDEGPDWAGPKLVYPPNSAGWNAAGQKPPFDG